MLIKQITNCFSKKNCLKIEENNLTLMDTSELGSLINEEAEHITNTLSTTGESEERSNCTKNPSFKTQDIERGNIIINKQAGVGGSGNGLVQESGIRSNATKSF
jgi:hypothetical protein